MFEIENVKGKQRSEKKKEEFDGKLRVAAYCRVSTRISLMCQF